MHQYTNGIYQHYNPTWHLEDSPWKSEQIRKMLAKHRIEATTVCEVGCGAGGILENLQRMMPSDAHFYGFEISNDAYRMCQERQSERLHFFLADLLETETQTFDLLLAIDLIEHLENPYDFMRRLRCRATWKLFHIPLDFNLINLLRPHIPLDMRRRIGHIHYFTKDLALALLEETGYQVIDWFYTPGALELQSTTSKMARLNPLRRLLFPFRADFTVRMLGGYSVLVLTQ